MWKQDSEVSLDGRMPARVAGQCELLPEAERCSECGKRMGFIKGRHGLGLRQLYHEGQCKQAARKRKDQQLGDLASEAGDGDALPSLLTQLRLARKGDGDAKSSCNESLKSVGTTQGEGLPILIHIYDVSKEGRIRKVNNILASRFSPLKFGGMFHVGVEINGVEWYYGGRINGTSGVGHVEPKMHPHHSFRQTLCLRYTKLSSEDLADLLSQLKKEYIADDYDILKQNCCHFADDFCQRLGVGRLPGWIYRLARLGAQVDDALGTLGL